VGVCRPYPSLAIFGPAQFEIKADGRLGVYLSPRNGYLNVDLTGRGLGHPRPRRSRKEPDNNAIAEAKDVSFRQVVRWHRVRLGFRSWRKMAQVTSHLGKGSAHLFGSPKPLLRILSECPAQELQQRIRKCRIEYGRPRAPLATEGMKLGECLVECHGQGEQVPVRIGRRGICRGPHVTNGAATVGGVRKAEIDENQSLFLLVNEEVLRLDIAMDDWTAIRPMERYKSVQEPVEPFQGRLQFERTVIFDVIEKGRKWEQLHYQTGTSTNLQDPLDLHDIGMIDVLVGRELASDKVEIPAELHLVDLQRPVPTETSKAVFNLEYSARPTPPEHPNDQEPAAGQRKPGHQVRIVQDVFVRWRHS
jgi:hypothetical protein